MSAAPILAASAVRKTFGGLVAVDDLTFAIEAGETVGLIGPNGSGKTTMLNMISGAARCDTGDIMFKARRSRGLPRIASHASASGARFNWSACWAN